MNGLLRAIERWGESWRGKRLLIAYSGGSDSVALLNLLLTVRRRQQLALGLLHVNHCWSAAGACVANEAAKQAAIHGLPYHERWLPPPCSDSLPSEEAARNARRCFFVEVARCFRYDAVVTAHHGNDQLETIFKRVLEGSHLTTLGMKSYSLLPGEIPLVRPLLSIEKKELVQWCERHALAFWEDPSNEECRYLRNRLRKELLPSIAKAFGKEIYSPLLQIGEESEQLAAYLFSAVSPLIACAVCVNDTVRLELSAHPSQHPYLLYQLVRQLACQEAFHLSREQLQQAAAALAMPSPRKRRWKSRSGTLSIVHQTIELQKSPPTALLAVDATDGTAGKTRC